MIAMIKKAVQGVCVAISFSWEPAGVAEEAPPTPTVEPAAPAAPGDPVVFEDKQLLDLDLKGLLDIEFVTASKKAEDVEEAPSIVTVFTRTDIDRLGAVRLIDLLKLTPGFVEVSAPMERNIATRGVHSTTSQDIVVLIDGIRMNDFLTNTAAPDGFLLDAAEWVEIIRGPGAALYGANALIGVVNIITRDPVQRPGFQAGAEAGIYDSYHIWLQQADKLENGGALFVAASYLQSQGTPVEIPGTEDIILPKTGQNITDGIADGENLTRPSASQEVWVGHYGPSFEGLVRYQSPGAWIFRLGLGNKTYYPQRTSTQGLVNLAEQLQRPVRTDLRASFDLSKSFGKEDGLGLFTLRPILQYFRHDERSQLVRDSFYEAAAEENRNTIMQWAGEEVRGEVDLEYTRTFAKLAFAEDLRLLLGFGTQYNVALDYELTTCRPDPDNQFDPSPYGDEVTGHDTACFRGAPLLDEGTVVDKWGNRIEQDKSYLGNGDDLLLGGFFQLSAALPLRMTVTVGGRVDYNPDYDPVLTPRLALVMPLPSHFYLKAVYSSAFVYPPFLYRTGNRQAGIIGNPDMVPQGIQTVELLLGYRLPMLRIELNGYYNYVSDFITFDDRRLSSTRAYYYSNVGDLQLMGLEGTLALSLFRGKLTVSLGGALTFPLESTDDLFLVDGHLGGPSKYPTFAGTFMVSYSPGEALSVTASGNLITRTDFDIAPGNRFLYVMGMDGKLISSKGPGDYDTGLFSVDLQARYSFARVWEVFLSGRNLLGSVYRMAGATMVPYATAGRQASLGVRFRN